MSFAETVEIISSEDGLRAPDAAERCPPVLIVALECQHPTASGRRLMLDQLDEVVVGRGPVGRIEREGRVATIFVEDGQTSRRHLLLRRVSSRWQVEDLGSKNGTVVNGRPVARATLLDGDLIEVGGVLLLFVQDDRPQAEPPERAREASLGSFHTLNVALAHRLRQIAKIAPSSVPVLVRGETGTGKELMARAIHDASGRRGPFVPVNCGALPRDLVESELFGHRRGAFTGARDDHEGLVRRAHRGTLFLDEIAELPPDSQVALLRVLQDGEVRPVGASDVVAVDVRVVAATHQDLVQRSQFRGLRSNRP